MMLASWYVALKHTFPTELPSELSANARSVRFARWLVMTGRLTDFGRYPTSDGDASTDQSSSGSPALTIA